MPEVAVSIEGDPGIDMANDTGKGQLLGCLLAVTSALEASYNAWYDFGSEAWVPGNGMASDDLRSVVMAILEVRAVKGYVWTLVRRGACRVPASDAGPCLQNRFAAFVSEDNEVVVDEPKYCDACLGETGRQSSVPKPPRAVHSKRCARLRSRSVEAVGPRCDFCASGIETVGFCELVSVAEAPVQTPPFEAAAARRWRAGTLSMLSDAPLNEAIALINEESETLRRGHGLSGLTFVNLPIGEEQLHFVSNFIAGCKMFEHFAPFFGGIGAVLEDALDILYLLHSDSEGP